VTARVRQGRAGPARAPGPAARRAAVLLLAFAAVLAVVAAERFWHDRDLRDLSGLQRATATVVDHQHHRRRADELVVRFRAGARDVQASIPSDLSPSMGDQVDVAHVPTDPSRVRTVRGWAPAFETWLAQALVLAGMGVLSGGFGLVSRARARHEEDSPVRPPASEPLGVRVVQGSLFVQGLFGASAALTAAPLVYVGAVPPGDREMLLGGVGLLLLLLGMALAFHLVWGRDGVWTTSQELVARRRGRLRRWPWDQVRELGVVVEKDQAVIAAARVDDAEQDGIGGDGWGTLARPLAGPVVAHRWKVHLQQVAAERGLPFTEGLRSTDLADSWTSTYVKGRGAVG
jgi:hypothetical protein